jgi:hypothetical protein
MGWGGIAFGVYIGVSNRMGESVYTKLLRD